MDTKRNCAERMRPILQAMEQSINAARQQRTRLPQTSFNSGLINTPTVNRFGNSHAARTTPLTTPITSCAISTGSDQHAGDSPRLKAKPKRLDAPTRVNPFPDSGYRSQTG